MAGFSEALEAVKAGGGAYREGWAAFGYPGVLRLEDPGAPYAPLLVVVRPETAGRRWTFSGAHLDLLADDWVLVP